METYRVTVEKQKQVDDDVVVTLLYEQVVEDIDIPLIIKAVNNTN